MIWQALTLIIQELDTYIMSLAPGETGPMVVAGNIGLSTTLGGNESFMDGRVVVSMPNLMEEDSLKNSMPLRTYGPNGVEQVLPPVFLNLYVLFTANYSSSSTDPATGSTQYGRGLTRIAQVISFFQGKRQFTVQNSPNANLLPDPLLQDLCVNMELVSLTFEQINYLWGALGGKQLPFVLYKAHVVPVKREIVSDRGGIVQDIQTETDHLNPSNP
ncbi:MAG: DUF4255 domain-containing protein [Bacteroidota bacterium]